MDADVTLWTVDGAQVGVFRGESTVQGWKVNDPSTFATSECTSVITMEAVAEFNKVQQAKLNSQTPYGILMMSPQAADNVGGDTADDEEAAPTATDTAHEALDDDARRIFAELGEAPAAGVQMKGRLAVGPAGADDLSSHVGQHNSIEPSGFVMASLLQDRGLAPSVVNKFTRLRGGAAREERDARNAAASAAVGAGVPDSSRRRLGALNLSPRGQPAGQARSFRTERTEAGGAQSARTQRPRGLGSLDIDRHAVQFF